MMNMLKISAAALALAGTAPAWAQNIALQASPPGCVQATSTAAEVAAAGDRTYAAMLPPPPGTVAAPPNPAMFAPDISKIVRENVFGDIWSRCGLSRRDRSLVTLGMLIALRADSELRYHFPIAIRNGLTRRELEEVIYQASAYAGFPAATSARRIAEETLPPK